MIDEKYIKGTIRESKSCMVINNGNATSTVRNLYYKEPRDEDYIKFIDVVWCKDCKFFDHSDFGKGEEYWCKHFVSTDDTTYCHKVCEDDFCAWGERREDAKTD